MATDGSVAWASAALDASFKPPSPSRLSSAATSESAATGGALAGGAATGAGPGLAGTAAGASVAAMAALSTASVGAAAGAAADRVPAARFVALQARLKKEHLLVADIRDRLQQVYKNIAEASHQLMTLQYEVRRRRFHTQQFLLNKITWPAFENSHRSWQEADRSTLLSEPHVELRHHATHYSSFLQQLYADPAAVGRALFSASKTDFGGAMADDVLRVLLLDLFGSAFQPHDERGVQQLFDAISEQQLAEHPPADMLQATGRTSLLTKLFVLYVRVYSADALTFLNTALREPLLAVLADDDLDLEIEPTMVWSRLPESAKADMFGEDHGTIPLDTTRLLGNPMFKAHLDQVYDRLLSFCTAIIASLTRALPVMPFTVRWLCAALQEKMRARGCQDDEIRLLLGDLVLLRFVGPTIASPAPYGIINDTPVSPRARRNLGLITRVLRDVTRGSYDATTEPYMQPFYERLYELGRLNLGQFFEQLVDLGMPVEQALSTGVEFPPLAVNHRGRRHAVVINSFDLYLLQDYFRRYSGFFPDEHPVCQALQKLPEVPKAFLQADAASRETSGRVIVLTIGDEVMIGSLLAEQDVLAHVAAKASAPASTDDRCEAVDDAVRKLRTCLSGMSLSMQWKHVSLFQLLETKLAKATLLQDRDQISKLSETLRCLHNLPAKYLADGASHLLSALEADFTQRSAYISYLVSSYQSLLVTLDMLNAQIDNAKLLQTVAIKFFNTLRVRRFLDQSTQEMAEFVAVFRAMEMLDERSQYLSNFLENIFARLTAESSWADASEAELDEAWAMLEKNFLCSIYRDAFWPHEIAWRNDQLFHEHIRKNLSHLSVDNEHIQIGPAHQAEAPWPAAQTCLLHMNAYKSPSDKLQCIVDCCSTIMSLMQLAAEQQGSAAGADDFFPILVYVILKANPPNLLSTVQYIRYFGSAAVESGQNGYWFAQFSSAVTFVQGIDDRQTPQPSPST